MVFLHLVLPALGKMTIGVTKFYMTLVSEIVDVFCTRSADISAPEGVIIRKYLVSENYPDLRPIGGQFPGIQTTNSITTC